MLSTGSPTCTTRWPTIAYIDQGGITLPDRDYYIKDDAKSVETREEYLKHVQKMFELAGDKPEVAAAEAKTVLAVETGLAQASMDRTERRNPKNRDHMMTVTEIAAAAPNFDLAAYFAEQRLAEVHHAQRRQSRLLQAGQRATRRGLPRRLEDLSALEDYQQLRSVLTKAFVEEDFEFNGKYMSGQKEKEPRWKRCVKATDSNLGHGTGPALR